MASLELAKIIEFWQKVALEKELLPRLISSDINLNNRKVTDIVGVRRCGKSSLLRFLYRKVLKNNNAMYINFEDPYFVLNNGPEVIESLIEAFQAYYSPNLKYIFLDEVQNVNSWERAVRKYEEAGKIKIVISGSSSKLLDGELATLLTGRHQSYHLTPLSFAEFLDFEKIEIKSKKDLIIKDSVADRALVQYLKTGGFPETVLEKDIEYAKQYFHDILQKDIISRFQINEKETIEEMAAFLLSNCGNLISTASLKRLYGLSFESVEKYLGYFSQAFLMHFISQFSFSLKSRQKSIKKAYGVDTGLVGAVSLSYSADWGRMLENTVCLELLRRGKEVFYYHTESRQEVDFVYKEAGEIIPIQVCWDLSDPKTLNREIVALKACQRELKTDKGLIIVSKKSKEMPKEITQVLATEWLLNF